MKNIIIASCRDWHRESFYSISPAENERWYYVASMDELFSRAEEIRPNYIFFLHWSWMVPKEIWENYECIVFHMTDVPFGRGGSPLQNLIVRGISETKVTALQMLGGIDSGPVYEKRSMSLDGSAKEIYLRAGKLCWKMIRSILDRKLTPTEQVGDAVFFNRRKPEESLLPKNSTSQEIYDFIRMLDAPEYPLAFLEYGEYRLEFSDAELDMGTVRAKVQMRKIEARGSDE